MIYLNNAGTSWPKPQAVQEAMSACSLSAPDAWPQVLEDAHTSVTSFFGIGHPERFLFTGGCTSALTLAMSDFPWQPGDRIVTSSHEHHALARWLVKLSQERGVDYTRIPPQGVHPIDLAILERELQKGGVRLLACTMASNVSGDLLPSRELVELAHSYDAFCLLDGAQTAGLLPIDLDELDADIFVFAGHKGTLGPQGVGGLYLGPRVSLASPGAVCDIPSAAGTSPLRCALPSYCDAGSVNLAAVAGLAAGIGWLREQGQTKLLDHTRRLTQQLLAGLSDIPGIKVFGGPDPRRRSGAVSISKDGQSPSALEKELRERHQIITRAGFHCAPMAHDTIGTSAEGTLRLSVGPFSTSQEIDKVLDVLRAI